MDRGHREAPAVIVVGQWTGQEASALRQALRMTIPEFAERLGVAERTVAKWEAGGSAMVPVLVMQAALDTVLERASEEAKRQQKRREEKLRLSHLDTEESNHGSDKPVTPWGKKAKERAAQLLPAGAVLEPGSSAGLLVYENRWAAPFAKALRRGGGQLVASGRIPVQAVLAALDATESVV
jgi:transcriptional regulator with XRE-family HTH domain